MTDKYEQYYELLHGTPQFNRYWREGHVLTCWGLAASVGVDECVETNEFDERMADDVRRFLDQSAFCRVIDNFQSFVVEIIVAAFANNTDLISPKKTTRISNVFRFSDMDELRKFAIEEGASDFGYQNVVDIDKDIRSRYGFGILEGRLRQKRVRRLIEIRNSIVHSRSRKTHRFVDVVGAKFDKVGDIVSFPHPVSVDAYLHNVAVDIDVTAKANFGLKPEHVR